MDCCTYIVTEWFFKEDLRKKNMLELNIIETGCIFLPRRLVFVGQPYPRSTAGLKNKECFCYTKEGN